MKGANFREEEKNLKAGSHCANQFMLSCSRIRLTHTKRYIINIYIYPDVETGMRRILTFMDGWMVA